MLRTERTRLASLRRYKMPSSTRSRRRSTAFIGPRVLGRGGAPMQLELGQCFAAMRDELRNVRSDAPLSMVAERLAMSCRLWDSLLRDRVSALEAQILEERARP